MKPRDLSWMDRALCKGVDPEVFFPESSAASSSARWFCRRCPVRPECLTYALADPDTQGIWGDTSKFQRTRMRNEAIPRQRRSVQPGGMAKVNAAKTHCKHGHEFTPENTAVYGGKRACRECYRTRTRAKRETERTAA